MTNTNTTKATETTTYAILDTCAGEYTVMGSGASPEAAMADAQHWAEGSEWDWSECRCAEVSAERAARIVEGDNDASDIWDSASDASEYAAETISNIRPGTTGVARSADMTARLPSGETRIKSRQVHTRTIAGTDWPVIDAVERHGSRRWIILRGLCNGVPDRVERYSTRRAALDAL